MQNLDTKEAEDLARANGVTVQQLKAQLEALAQELEHERVDAVKQVRV